MSLVHQKVILEQSPACCDLETDSHFIANQSEWEKRNITTY